MDVLALNQSGCLGDVEYLQSLINSTSLRAFISAPDVLSLRTRDDVQAFLDSVHYRLIKRFLRFCHVNVDALNPFQLFALLDMQDEMFNFPTHVIEFVTEVVEDAKLDGRTLQVAKLGLYFLFLGIRDQSLTMLRDDEFRRVACDWLSQIKKQSSSMWLSQCKVFLATMNRLFLLRELLGARLDFVCSISSVKDVMRGTLYHRFSRFGLLHSVEAIYRHLDAGTNSEFEVVVRLQCLFGQLREGNCDS